MSQPNTEAGTVIDGPIHLPKGAFDRLPEIAQEALIAAGIPLSLTNSVSTQNFSVATASVDTSQDLAGLVGSLRWDWGNKRGDWILRLDWGAVSPKTAVFVAIGEGAPGGPTAGKFIGASKFTLYNVCPRPGGVDIWLNINSGSDIRIYVDYLTVTIDVFGP